MYLITFSPFGLHAVARTTIGGQNIKEILNINVNFRNIDNKTLWSPSYNNKSLLFVLFYLLQTFV